MGDEVEQIEEMAELLQVREQARDVLRKTAITTILITLLALLLPSLA